MEILISEETKVAGFGGQQSHRVHSIGFSNQTALLQLSVERLSVSLHLRPDELRAIGQAAIKVADAIDQRAAELVA